MAEMTVKIVTPDGTRYSHRATMIVARTTNGELGIMPHHVNMIAPLEVGVFKVRRVDDENHVDWVAVNGGILMVKDNVVTIVADSAERSRDIDISRAEHAKMRAEREIEEAKASNRTDQEMRARVALQRAINRISVGNK